VPSLENSIADESIEEVNSLAMKLLGFIATLSGSFCLAVSLQGHEVTTCRSPDKKFALHCVSADKQPYNGEAKSL
jgi:hypothetical protein